MQLWQWREKETFRSVIYRSEDGTRSTPFFGFISLEKAAELMTHGALNSKDGLYVTE